MSDVLFVAAVLVLVIALGVTGVGAWVWGRAISAVVQARAHSNQADAEEATMRYAASAIDNAPQRTPAQRISDDELRAAQQWQRQADQLGDEEEEPETPTTDDRPTFSAFDTGLFKAAQE